MYIAFVFIGAGRPTLFVGVLSGLLFLEVALLLCLVFIPKVSIQITSLNAICGLLVFLDGISLS